MAIKQGKENVMRNVILFLLFVCVAAAGCQSSKYRATYYQTTDDSGEAIWQYADGDAPIERKIVIENVSIFAATEKTNLAVAVSDGSTMDVGKSAMDPNSESIKATGGAVGQVVGSAAKAASGM